MANGIASVEATTEEDKKTACQLISLKIKALGDWRAETLSLIRQLIREADRGVVEEVK